MPSLKAKKDYQEKHKYLCLCIRCPKKRYKSFTMCKVCLEKSRERVNFRRETYPEKVLLSRAKSRAKSRGTLCTISEWDISIPEFCPILGIPLFCGINKLHPNSPTLDELIHGHGYVPGNVQVVSHKANTMKSNASPRELHRFADWIKANVPN